MNNNALSDEFELAMRDAVKVCRKKKYNPSYFAQMLDEYGGVNTAKRLLAASNTSSGFTELFMLGLLDYSAEALALREEFRPLFTAEELDIARARLAELGVKKD